MDKTAIEDMLAGYTYGNSQIYLPDFQIKINFIHHQVLLTNIHAYGKNLKKGLCGELMSTLYLELKDKTSKHVLRASGTEPLYFSNGGETHCYLILSDVDLGDKTHTEDAEDIERVLSKNPLVVDPSFGKVIPFSGSGYSTNFLVGGNCEMWYSNDNILEDNEGMPLALTSEGQLVGLVADFRENRALSISIMTENDREQYGLHSEKLSGILEDNPEISRVVEALRAKTPIYVPEVLRAEETVSII